MMRPSSLAALAVAVLLFVCGLAAARDAVPPPSAPRPRSVGPGLASDTSPRVGLLDGSFGPVLGAAVRSLEPDASRGRALGTLVAAETVGSSPSPATVGASGDEAEVEGAWSGEFSPEGSAGGDAASPGVAGAEALAADLLEVTDSSASVSVAGLLSALDLFMEQDMRYGGDGGRVVFFSNGTIAVLAADGSYGLRAPVAQAFASLVGEAYPSAPPNGTSAGALIESLMDVAEGQGDADAPQGAAADAADASPAAGGADASSPVLCSASPAPSPPPPSPAPPAPPPPPLVLSTSSQGASSSLSSVNGTSSSSSSSSATTTPSAAASATSASSSADEGDDDESTGLSGHEGVLPDDEGSLGTTTTADATSSPEGEGQGAAPAPAPAPEDEADDEGSEPASEDDGLASPPSSEVSAASSPSSSTDDDASSPSPSTAIATDGSSETDLAAGSDSSSPSALEALGSGVEAAPPAPSDSSNRWRTIVAGVVGSVAGVAVATGVAAAFFVVRRRRRAAGKRHGGADGAPGAGPGGVARPSPERPLVEGELEGSSEAGAGDYGAAAHDDGFRPPAPLSAADLEAALPRGDPDSRKRSGGLAATILGSFGALHDAGRGSAHYPATPPVSGAPGGAHLPGAGEDPAAAVGPDDRAGAARAGRALASRGAPARRGGVLGAFAGSLAPAGAASRKGGFWGHGHAGAGEARAGAASGGSRAGGPGAGSGGPAAPPPSAAGAVPAPAAAAAAAGRGGVRGAAARPPPSAGVSPPSLERPSAASLDRALFPWREPLALPWTDGRVSPDEISIVTRPDGSPWLLGSGAYGSVYKALLDGVQPVAVKVIAGMDHPRRRDEFIREVTLLRGCRDHNIVQFVGACIRGAEAMLVTEFMEFGDLWRAATLRNARGERVFAWRNRGARAALDIARGLHFLHSRSIAHLDLKSANILLARDGTAKIADVGFARVISRSHSLSCSGSGVGTFAWSAPEVLIGDRCSPRADLYSFGVVLWEILTGETPLRGNLRPIKVPEECPPAVVDLFEQCIAHDPHERPTTRELVERLTILVEALDADKKKTAKELKEKNRAPGGEQEAAAAKARRGADAASARKGADGARDGAPRGADGTRDGAPRGAGGTRDGAPGGAGGARDGAPGGAGGARDRTDAAVGVIADASEATAMAAAASPAASGSAVAAAGASGTPEGSDGGKREAVGPEVAPTLAGAPPASGATPAQALRAAQAPASAQAPAPAQASTSPATTSSGGSGSASSPALASPPSASPSTLSPSSSSPALAAARPPAPSPAPSPARSAFLSLAPSSLVGPATPPGASGLVGAAAAAVSPASRAVRGAPLPPSSASPFAASSFSLPSMDALRGTPAGTAGSASKRVQTSFDE